MSGSSDVNLKQSLRKLEYPLCAQEALRKIGELLSFRSTSIKSMDLALALMAEFVFYEQDRRGNRRSHAVTPLVELELLQILFEYLNTISIESFRNTLFLNLFSLSSANTRLGILSKLVSFAVVIPSPQILVSASTWMQQLGNTSPSSCKLAEVLVTDNIHFASNPDEIFKNLASIAPDFTANFLTATAENYYMPKKEPMFPPEVLLKCATQWMTENPSLCVAAQQKPPALPPMAIAMEATTPIAGLLRWCVLAPLYNQNQDIYSKFYLAILNSISNIPPSNPPRAINVQHLTAIVAPLMAYFQELKIRRESKSNLNIVDAALEMALDRFAQSIQVALSVNGVYGHLNELFNALEKLPFNKLLSIIISRHKLSKSAPILIV